MLFDLLDYIIGLIKMVVYSIVYIGRLRFCLNGKYSRKCEIRVFHNSKIQLGKEQLIRSGVKIRTFKDGNLNTGNRVGFNNDCLINCAERITIGDNVIFGQGVKVYDHDHTYKNIDVPIRDAGFVTEPIEIGDNVWIGSGCVILKGTRIGSGTVIGAGTIVKGSIPKNSVVVNKREMLVKEKV